MLSFSRKRGAGVDGDFSYTGPLMWAAKTRYNHEGSLNSSREWCRDGTAHSIDSAVSRRRLSARRTFFGDRGGGDFSVSALSAAADDWPCDSDGGSSLLGKSAESACSWTGSFVTAKPNPDDVDAVILLPPDFEQQVEAGTESALDLEEMLLTRRPEEIFAAEDEADWNEWVEFFSQTREADGRHKGLVEIEL